MPQSSAHPLAAHRSSVKALIPTMFVAVVSAVLAIANRWDVICVDQIVYRMAGRSLLGGVDNLYDLRTDNGLPFTYPPFAAVVFTPLSWLSDHGMAQVFLILSVACLTRIGFLIGRAVGLGVPGFLLAIAVALWTEPVMTTLGWGQINLLLVYLIVEDFLGLGARFPAVQGILTGVASGIKLTPAIFLLMLLVQRRFRAAGVMTATIVATLVIGFLVAPESTVAFSSGIATDAARVGDPYWPTNASLSGISWLVLGDSPARQILWAVLAAVALFVSYRALTHPGSPPSMLRALIITGMCGALISPISWQHHWVWGPVCLLYFVQLRRFDERRNRHTRILDLLIGGWVICLFAWAAYRLLFSLNLAGEPPLVVPLGSLGPGIASVVWFGFAESWKRRRGQGPETDGLGEIAVASHPSDRVFRGG